MPYSSVSDLPAGAKKNYKGHCLEVFRTVFNDSFKRHKRESMAFAAAHTAAQNCMTHGKE